MYIRDNEATSEEFEAMSLPFTVPNASGQDIQLSSKYTHITLDNRAEYVRLAINYRFVLYFYSDFRIGGKSNTAYIQMSSVVSCTLHEFSCVVL